LTANGSGEASAHAAEFDRWARYYDLIHEGLPGEAEFYVGHAVRCGGKTLELGCGTGRLAIPMAMSGVDVAGLDNSAAMLERCREKLRAVGKTSGTLTLVAGDMADFDLGTEFSFIAMAYRTFMHLLTPEDQQRCLAAVRRHLADDGRFMLNCWVPKPSLIATTVGGPHAGLMRLAGRYPIPDTGRVVLHHHSATSDEFLQLLYETHRIQELDAQGNVIEEVTLTLTRAWITPREMSHLVRLAGFDVEALFGDFDCGPLTEKSTESIWALRKA